MGNCANGTSRVWFKRFGRSATCVWTLKVPLHTLGNIHFGAIYHFPHGLPRSCIRKKFLFKWSTSSKVISLRLYHSHGDTTTHFIVEGNGNSLLLFRRTRNPVGDVDMRQWKKHLIFTFSAFRRPGVFHLFPCHKQIRHREKETLSLEFGANLTRSWLCMYMCKYMYFYIPLCHLFEISGKQHKVYFWEVVLKLFLLDCGTHWGAYIKDLNRFVIIFKTIYCLK